MYAFPGHAEPTRVTPVFHLQLKIVEDSSEEQLSHAASSSSSCEAADAKFAVRVDADEEEVLPPFLALPEELKLAIFSKLSFEWRCCVIPAVCRDFFELSKSASYWNTLDLNSISIGSFHLFNSLKESLLPLVEHSSLMESE